MSTQSNIESGSYSIDNTKDYNCCGNRVPKNQFTYISQILDNQSSSRRHNRQRLQGLQSKVCGLNCIFILDAAARVYNIQKYLQQKFFSTDHHRNDQDVSLWVNQQYGNLYNEISKTSHIQ